MTNGKAKNRRRRDEGRSSFATYFVKTLKVRKAMEDRWMIARRKVARLGRGTKKPFDFAQGKRMGENRELRRNF